jgi:hypothetical protein
LKEHCVIFPKLTSSETKYDELGSEQKLILTFTYFIISVAPIELQNNLLLEPFKKALTTTANLFDDRCPMDAQGVRLRNRSDLRHK